MFGGFEGYKLDLNSIADEHVDIETSIETKMKIEDRYKALGKLNSLYLHFTPPNSGVKFCLTKKAGVSIIACDVFSQLRRRFNED